MIASQSGITVMAWKSAKENLDALKQYKDGLLSYTDGVEKQVKVLLNCRMVWMN